MTPEKTKEPRGDFYPVTSVKNKKIKQKVLECIVCGKNFIRKHNVGPIPKYCSYKCYIKLWKRNNYKKMLKYYHKSYLKHKNAPINSKLVIKVKCKFCGKEFRVRKKIIEKYNKGKFCSHSCKGVFLIKKLKKKDTKIEKIVEEWLTKNKIDYQKNKIIKLFTTTTIPDFFIKPNICIYCDGVYWHSLPKVIKRDKIINKELSQLNFKVIRLSGNEIKNGDFYRKVSI